MTAKGFIYIAKNESIPDLLKIGQCSYVPNKILDELTNTSIPTPYHCLYFAFVENPDQAENTIHELLEDFRFNDNRDFFDISLDKAISKIKDAMDVLYDKYENNPEYEKKFNTSKRGFVYVALNDSMPGLLKIGHTARAPEKRMMELSNPTVPEPFDFVYFALVENSEESEKEVHKLLSEFRVNNYREFFRISADKAIAEIQILLDILYQNFSDNKSHSVKLKEKVSNIILDKKALEREIKEKKELEEKQQQIKDVQLFHSETVRYLNENKDFFDCAMDWIEDAFQKGKWWQNGKRYWIGNHGDEQIHPWFKYSKVANIQVTKNTISIYEYPKFIWNPYVRTPHYRLARKWYRTGELYLGEFPNNSIGGKGITFYKNNSIFIGEYHDERKAGLYVSPKREYLQDIISNKETLGHDCKLFSKNVIANYSKMSKLAYKKI
jgi:hypothetical protein